MPDQKTNRLFSGTHEILEEFPDSNPFSPRDFRMRGQSELSVRFLTFLMPALLSELRWNLTKSGTESSPDRHIFSSIQGFPPTAIPPPPENLTGNFLGIPADFASGKICGLAQFSGYNPRCKCFKVRECCRRLKQRSRNRTGVSQRVSNRRQSGTVQPHDFARNVWRERLVQRRRPPPDAAPGLTE
jgi:hypothetical protein